MSISADIRNEDHTDRLSSLNSVAVLDPNSNSAYRPVITTTGSSTTVMYPVRWFSSDGTEIFPSQLEDSSFQPLPAFLPGVQILLPAEKEEEEPVEKLANKGYKRVVEP